MPKKKESRTAILPGLDIFGQPLLEADRGVLLKPHYRRKQLAGFVPLWNEFFRCYHLAGVSVQSVYLWAYLRQYEHERREWNAVSDISWPGRRDMAETLGVSISHLPNLLNELRLAGLVSFQLVLPGFEELAGELNSSIEEVRERAAEYGVNPKVDGTLYRTADPYTKTEFATLTELKFCKGCKVYRYCEGAREARTRIINEPKTVATAKINKAERSLVASTIDRKIVLNNVIEIERIEVETPSVSKKVQLPLSSRVSERFNEKTETVSKKERSANPSRIKTNMYQTNQIIQPEKPTMPQQVSENLVVSSKTEKEFLPTNEPSKDKQPKGEKKSDISQEAETKALQMLVQFGFDTQVATHLVQQAISYGKEKSYIQSIIRYANENARQNPQGMARYLIERGEERLSRADRWQQQTLFDIFDDAEEARLDAEANSSSGSTGVYDVAYSKSTGVQVGSKPNSIGVYSPDSADLTGVHSANDSNSTGVYQNNSVKSRQNQTQIRLAETYRLSSEGLQWWQEIVAHLEQAGFQNAAEIFHTSIGLRQKPDKLIVVLRSLFDQQRAIAYKSQLERAVAAVTGELPWIEFTN